jgi:RNA polymerase sigma-70 factor (ECF subfamily)
MPELRWSVEGERYDVIPLRDIPIVVRRSFNSCETAPPGRRIACSVRHGYDQPVASESSDDPRAATFAATLAAAREGEKWAFATLWVEYAPAVNAFLRARGSREPEDITSETFIAVFDRISEFVGGEAQFRSFLFSVTYRRLVDELRLRSRRGEPLELSTENDTRSSPSAEHDALERVGDASVRRIIESLPENQRSVMALRIIADLSIEQISVILDKRPGAIKALQRRALERLRKDFPPSRTPEDHFFDGM